jgi:hypothetical protein
VNTAPANRISRSRLVILAVIVVCTVAGVAGYLVLAPGATPRAPVSAGGAADPSDVAAVAAVPHLVFRSTALGDGYGHVALSTLDNPDGPRTVTVASCERVHASRGAAICLSAEGGFTASYAARVLGPDWKPLRTLPMPGIPSRARVSRDEAHVATTSFIHGDSYANPGQFSTRTLVSRIDGSQTDNIEEFALEVNGRAVTAADRNLWGVTFVDGDTFYATAASGGKTWLVRGSLTARRLVALQEDAECPSVSPDGTHIVYKKRGKLPAGQWRLVAYTVASGAETPLAETRSVDDQVDWLDDQHVVYGLPRSVTSGAAATSDVWVVASDGTGSPEVLVHDAWSPAVVR